MADAASVHQCIAPSQADAMLYDEAPNDNAIVFDNENDFEHTNFLPLQKADNVELLTNPSQAIRTNARRIEVTLLKILTELEAPLWAFNDIMDWALDAYQTGYNFMPRQSSYQSQMHTLKQWVGMEHMHPTVVDVALPGVRPDDTIPVTTFDFVSQLHSLLADAELNQLDKLVVNRANPFTQYVAPQGLLKETFSGSWYKQAWQHMESHTNCNFMIPIILYIDKTQLSHNGKLSLFPVQMTLAIFTEETRRTSRSWRPLGYIANEEFFYSAAERAANTPDTKNERLHRQLAVILQSYYRAQEPNALSNIPIQLGTACQRVNLYVPLEFIIGDAEGGDHLCSRWTYRRETCLHLCRTCDVATVNATCTERRCNRIRVADIKHLLATGTKASLDAMAQRPGFNAFYNIDCGGDPYGIFSMVHTEGLHAIEVGLVKYMIQILLDELTLPAKVQLDTMVKRLLHQPRQHGYKAFPRILWQDGVTGITNLTGDQRMGKLLAITITALTLQGSIFFITYLPGGSTTWQKMTYVFQQILCYWAWLKQDTFWMAHDTDACAQATAAIKIMMSQLQTLWPRDDGLEWNITKLHEQFHVPMDIHRHGNHKNVHSGPQEHNHIDIKKAARKTQLNRKTLDEQTGCRVMERLVIQRAYDFVTADIRLPPGKDNNVALGVVNASKGVYCLVSDTATGASYVDATLHWHRTKHDGLVPLHHDHIIRVLITTLFPDYAELTVDGTSLALQIPFFTEYERNGFIYRAHPNYRGNGAYYDWAQIQWEIGDNDSITGNAQYQNYIGRIHGFILHPDGDTYAVVHSTIDNKPRRVLDHGVFANYWHLEVEGNNTSHWPVLQLVHVDCLLEHVCMIPYDEQDTYTWIHIWNPTEWPDCFMTILSPGQDIAILDHS